MAISTNYKKKYGFERIGMPRPTVEHQRTITRVLFYFNLKFGFKDFEMISESCISDNDLNDRAPDLVIFDKDGTVVSIIEIANNKGIKGTTKRITEWAAKNDIKEVMIYNYEKKEWHKYTDLIDIESTASFSDATKTDFSSFVIIK